VPAAEYVFLAEVRKGAGDRRVAADFADPELVGQAVHALA
jgi:hypothetical protein